MVDTIFIPNTPDMGDDVINNIVSRSEVTVVEMNTDLDADVRGKIIIDGSVTMTLTEGTKNDADIVIPPFSSGNNNGKYLKIKGSGPLTTGYPFSQDANPSPDEVTQGDGVITLSKTDADEITVTRAVTNPDFTGITTGVKAILTDDDGVASSLVVSSVAANVVTFTAPVPANIGTVGEASSLVFLPTTALTGIQIFCTLGSAAQVVFERITFDGCNLISGVNNDFLNFGRVYFRYCAFVNAGSFSVKGGTYSLLQTTIDNNMTFNDAQVDTDQCLVLTNAQVSFTNSSFRDKNSKFIGSTYPIYALNSNLALDSTVGRARTNFVDCRGGRAFMQSIDANALAVGADCVKAREGAIITIRDSTIRTYNKALNAEAAGTIASFNMTFVANGVDYDPLQNAGFSPSGGLNIGTA